MMVRLSLSQAHVTFVKAIPSLVKYVRCDHGDADGSGELGVTDELKDLLCNDHRTQTVMTRAEICSAFRSTIMLKTDNETREMQNSLFQLISTDQYYAEIITSPEICATLGRVKYMRDVLMGLQPDYDAVMAMHDSHKDMLETLQVAAKGLMVELTQTLATSTAEQKAKKDEEKAALREEKRLQKVKARQEQRDAKKADRDRQKEKERETKALEKENANKEKEKGKEDAEKEQEAAGTEQAKPARTRRLRIPGASEMNALDPTILRNKLPAGYHVATVDDLDRFVSEVARNIDDVHVYKSKQGTIKKIFQSWPHIAKDTVLSYTKKLASVTLLILNSL